jgi:hypothetical protein
VQPLVEWTAEHRLELGPIGLRVVGRKMVFIRLAVRPDFDNGRVIGPAQFLEDLDPNRSSILERSLGSDVCGRGGEPTSPPVNERHRQQDEQYRVLHDWSSIGRSLNHGELGIFGNEIRDKEYSIVIFVPDCTRQALLPRDLLGMIAEIDSGALARPRRDHRPGRLNSTRGIGRITPRLPAT